MLLEPPELKLPPELPDEIELEFELLTLRLLELLLREELLTELERFTELLLVFAVEELLVEELLLPLLTLRLELELLLPTLRLELELLLPTLREVLLPLLTLRLELELLLPTLRLLFEELLPTLRLELELVLLGRSYVVPDCVERDALEERLDVAGATLLTDELPDCVLTLRLELELVDPTLRLELELEPATLRLELELLLPTLRLLLELVAPTLRLLLELEAPTLRLLLEAATLRLGDVEAAEPLTDLDATPDAVVTVRLALEPDIAIRSVVERLRFLSQPPPFTLRFPT